MNWLGKILPICKMARQCRLVNGSKSSDGPMSPASPPWSTAAQASGVCWKVEAWVDNVEPPCTTGNQRYPRVWGAGKDILSFNFLRSSLTLANVLDPCSSVLRIVFSYVTPEHKWTLNGIQSKRDTLCLLPARSCRYYYGRKPWRMVISKDSGGQVGARLQIKCEHGFLNLSILPLSSPRHGSANFWNAWCGWG